MPRNPLQRINSRNGKIGGLLSLGALALAGSAAIVNHRTAQAEKANPPRGSFVTTHGVRLHYIECGRGRPIVFLHGNGMTVEDMRISGIMDAAAAQSFRAIAFDRPGFGHSERPRVTAWTAAAQAALLPEAFERLGIDRPIVVGHSLGTMVALALALNRPDHVAGLVLASGYYFPKARVDIALFSPPAIPLVGDLLCYTVAPLMGEAMAPRMIAKMFSPQDVPARFESEFPMSLMVRPSQIRASSKDAAHMIPDAFALSDRYGELDCPIAVLAGDADEVVDYREHARRLQGSVPGSVLDVFKGAGHMVHHVDPARVMRAASAMALRPANARRAATLAEGVS